jgi:hypothetical protein
VRGALIVAAAAAACVPSATDKDPHGGFSIHLAPSAATKGQPFTTADGWTITFTKTALRLSVTGETGYESDKTIQPDLSISGDSRVLSATADCELRLTALAVGKAVVKITLTGGSVERDAAGINGDHPCGLDPAMLARFESDADNTNNDALNSFGGAAANVAFVADAEKNGRRVHLELYASSFNADAMLHDQLVTTAVQANTGVPLKFPVFFESIFVQTADSQTPSAPAFETIANADTNNDGIITAGELRAVPISPSSGCGDSSGDDDDTNAGSSSCQNLFDVLVGRMGYAPTDPSAPLVVDPTAGGPFDPTPQP